LDVEGVPQRGFDARSVLRCRLPLAFERYEPVEEDLKSLSDG
jgi:hypothetical protein